jgi:hypothetical protein
MTLHRLQAIGRARRGESATAGKPGCKSKPIKPDQPREERPDDDPIRENEPLAPADPPPLPCKHDGAPQTAPLESLAWPRAPHQPQHPPGDSDETALSSAVWRGFGELRLQPRDPPRLPLGARPFLEATRKRGTTARRFSRPGSNTPGTPHAYGVAIVAPTPRASIHREPATTFPPAPRQHLPSRRGCHASPEAVDLLSTPPVRLKRPLHLTVPPLVEKKQARIAAHAWPCQPLMTQHPVRAGGHRLSPKIP